MMLWPPMVPVVWPMPSAVVAIANAGIDSMNDERESADGSDDEPEHQQDRRVVFLGPSARS